jgi:methionine synthase I (cobalamin-dependent)
VRIPVFISGTIVDNSGRTLSGQTNEAFWNSVSHAKPMAIGLNCALGATDMHKYVANLSACADCYVFCYPNAGLPNAMGGYDQKGPEMAEEIRPFCELFLAAYARLPARLRACCVQHWSPTLRVVLTALRAVLSVCLAEQICVRC